jgi:hypothetical protein
MKKTLSAVISAFIFSSSLLTFTGCQGEIFNSIREEIELEDSTVSGDIRSVVRYNESGTDYLFLDNGDIYYKLASASYYGAWTSDANAPNDYTIKVAADSTYLYALGITYEEDYDEGENVIQEKTLYYKSSVSGTWTAIKTISSSTSATLFCTNTPQSANRYAFIRIGDYVYKLDGATDPTATSSSLTCYSVSSGAASSLTLGSTSFDATSCVYYDSCIYFFKLLASCTNETASTAATYMYYASSDTFYYSNDGWSSYNTKDMSCDDINSIAVTSNYFLLGTDSGLQEASNSSGVPTSDADDGDFANADSTLSSTYKVNVVLAVTPSASMTGTDVYGSITYVGSSVSDYSDNIGLWAYYPTRAKWNRE